MQKDKDMLEEYDFSKGIQGKYAKRYAEGTNVIVIEPDVAKYICFYIEPLAKVFKNPSTSSG